MRCDCKPCWMNSITQIIHKASTLSAFKTSCCQSTLWKCRIFMAKVHVMFHIERALPRTNTFVNNQTTLSLQAQANEVWELMHHNGILVALQHPLVQRYVAHFDYLDHRIAYAPMTSQLRDMFHLAWNSWGVSNLDGGISCVYKSNTTFKRTTAKPLDR